MYDIIIIGAGPAGLTSALYALRANKKVLVLEAKSYGGQIINASNIENYPGIESISGFQFATNLYNQVKKLSGIIKFEVVLKIKDDKTVVTQKNEYKTKSIIIANGVQNRKLNIKGEKEFLGKGVSYCATCDGAFYKDKLVAVNGGGNTALDDAIYLSDIASKVYLIHRRKSFRGEEKFVEQLKEKDNVEFVLDSNIVEITGGEKVEAITVENKKEEKKKIKIDGLFIAIGQVPNNDVFSNVVDLDDYGYIKSIDGVHTKTEGVYVAGDTRVKTLRQLTTAVSDGSVAASIAVKELK